MGKRVLTLEVLLSKEIEYLLEADEYKEKQKLPSERELAEYFKYDGYFQEFDLFYNLIHLTLLHLINLTDK